MLHAVFPSAPVLFTVGQNFCTRSVLVIILEVAVVDQVTLAVCEDAVAVLVIQSPLTAILAAVCPPVSSITVFHTSLVLALVPRAICKKLNAPAVRHTVPEMALVLCSVVVVVHTVPMFQPT